MKKIYAAAAVIIFALVGCADNLTPQQQVFKIKGDFQFTVEQFDNYTDRPVCTVDVTFGCVEQEVIDRGFEIAEDVRAELATAETAVRSAGPEEASAWVALARAATARLVGFLIDKGVLGS